MGTLDEDLALFGDPEEDKRDKGVALRAADLGLVSPTGIAGQHPGLVEPGNVDLTTRPDTANPDGSHSSVRSASFNLDGKETLVPTIGDDGRQLSDDEAVAQYRKTGKHLGKFATPDAANAYADKLHRQQAGEFNAPKVKGGPDVDADLALFDHPDSGSPSFWERAKSRIAESASNVVSGAKSAGKALLETASDASAPYPVAEAVAGALTNPALVHMGSSLLRHPERRRELERGVSDVVTLGTAQKAGEAMDPAFAATAAKDAEEAPDYRAAGQFAGMALPSPTKLLAGKAAGAVPGAGALAQGAKGVAAYEAMAVPTAAANAALNAPAGQRLAAAEEGALDAATDPAGLALSGGLPFLATKARRASQSETVQEGRNRVIEEARKRSSKDVSHDIAAAKGYRATDTAQKHLAEVHDDIFALTQEHPELRPIFAADAEKGVPKLQKFMEKKMEPREGLYHVVEAADFANREAAAEAAAAPEAAAVPREVSPFDELTGSVRSTPAERAAFQEEMRRAHGGEIPGVTDVPVGGEVSATSEEATRGFTPNQLRAAAIRAGRGKPLTPSQLTSEARAIEPPPTEIPPAVEARAARARVNEVGPVDVIGERPVAPLPPGSPVHEVAPRDIVSARSFKVPKGEGGLTLQEAVDGFRQAALDAKDPLKGGGTWGETDAAMLNRRADQLVEVYGGGGKPKFNPDAKVSPDGTTAKQMLDILEPRKNSPGIKEEIARVREMAMAPGEPDMTKRIPALQFRKEVTASLKALESDMGQIQLSGQGRHAALEAVYDAGKGVLDNWIDNSGADPAAIQQLRKINKDYFLLKRAETAMQSRGWKEANRPGFKIPHGAAAAIHSGNLGMMAFHGMTHPWTIPGMAVGYGALHVAPAAARALNWKLANMKPGGSPIPQVNPAAVARLVLAGRAGATRAQLQAQAQQLGVPPDQADRVADSQGLSP